MKQILLNAGSSGVAGWSQGKAPALWCDQKWAYGQLIYPASTTPTTELALIKGSLVHTGYAQANARLMAVQQGWDPERYVAPLDGIERHARECDADLGGGDHWGRWVALAQETVSAFMTYAGYGDIASGGVAGGEPTYPQEIVAVEHFVEAWYTAAGLVAEPADAARRRQLVGMRDRASWKPEMLVELVDGLGPPYPHTLRADLIERGPRLIDVIDAKTAYRIDKTKRDGFTLSGATLGFLDWAAGTYGAEFGAFRIQMMRLTAGSYDSRFPRFAPDPAPWALSCFGQTVVDTYDRVAGHIRSGRDPWNYPKVVNEQGCVGRYGPCQWREKCRWGPGT